MARTLPLLLAMARPLAPIASPLARHPILSPYRAQVALKLRMAGMDQTLPADAFIACQFVIGVIGLLIAAVGQFLIGNAALTLIGVILPFYPGLWLGKLVKRRHSEILRALPDTLDLLTLSVEAGRDLMASVRHLLIHRPDDVLSVHFGRILHEIQLGRDRSMVFSEAAADVGQQQFSDLLNALSMALDMGMSLGHILRVQADMIRTHLTLQAERRAQESAVKILFPMVVFIFPPFFIALLGPTIVTAIQQLGGLK